MAWQVLLDNNIRTLPVDLKKIASNNNIVIIDYQNHEDLLKIIDKQNLRFQTNGFTLIIDRNYIIAFNNIDKLTNRITIAHELGHIYMQHLYNGNNEDFYEKQANFFADRLLMPLIILKNLNLCTAEEIMSICLVPIKDACRRANRLVTVEPLNKYGKMESEQKLLNNFINYIEVYHGKNT